MPNPRCFVIIGYGKKPSYAKQKVRSLDLDQTYTLLIKPVFNSLNIDCNRSIDQNLSGSIDTVMLEEIKNADIALADISTLNANVMWELGVRHALKPHHTIMICEKEQMDSIPFDVNHFVVYQYTHSEEGIPYEEVRRFRKLLKKQIIKILNQNPKQIDSPVFTFLAEELQERGGENNFVDKPVEFPSSESLASILDKADQAKNKKDYKTALKWLATAKKFASENMTLRSNLSFIITQQALCTYKLKKPNELESLVKAKKMLEPLKPLHTQDIEVLGLSGAVHKRLNELTNDIQYLEDAIQFYEKGFQLKQDYYNGINVAFMLYKKASLLKLQNNEWEEVMRNADYIRDLVLKIALTLEGQINFNDSPDAIWVLLTTAEAYYYQKNESKLIEYEIKAQQIAEKNNNTFALSAYNEQKEKIQSFFHKLS